MDISQSRFLAILSNETGIQPPLILLSYGWVVHQIMSQLSYIYKILYESLCLYNFAFLQYDDQEDYSVTLSGLPYISVHVLVWFTLGKEMN